jgi:hypothetical protein
VGGAPEVIFKASAAVTAILAEMERVFVTASVVVMVWLPDPAVPNVAATLPDTPAVSVALDGSVACASLLENFTVPA